MFTWKQCLHENKCFIIITHKITNVIYNHVDFKYRSQTEEFLPCIVGNKLVQRLWYRFLSWLISNTFSHSFTVIWFLMLSAVCSSSLSSFPPNWGMEKKQTQWRSNQNSFEEKELYHKQETEHTLQINNLICLWSFIIIIFELQK